jgi:glycine/D-amino acid oxidase-like deaminating enzyme
MTIKEKTSWDVIIIGGGLMGASLAYNLKDQGFPGSILILEKDPTYEKSTTTLSVGGIRRQFSTEVNIRISQYGLSFYGDFGRLMEVLGERPEIEFKPWGYLFLASERTWPALSANWELQRSLGCSTELLSPEETLRLIPHLNLEGIVGSSFSPGDGYMDPYAALQGYLKKAKSLGVKFHVGEVTEVKQQSGRVTGVVTKEGTTYEGPIVVNCAGPYAGAVGRMAGLDIPVEPVRRMVYYVHPAVIFDYPLPLTIDTTGCYFRHEAGGHIITGKSRQDEPVGENFQCDYSYFQDEIWPSLAFRVPVFETLKLIRGWAGLYEMNHWDFNALLGSHPELAGFYLAAGFSGHGFQQAPAVGRGLAELIRTGRYVTLDLSPLDYSRYLRGEKLLEREVV